MEYKERGISSVLFVTAMSFLILTSCDQHHLGVGSDDPVNRDSIGSKLESDTTIIEITDLRETYGFNVAWGINDYGQIAGGSMLWDPDIGILDMGRIFARSMNNYGQVVGSSGSQAAIWDINSGIRKLGHLDGTRSTAYDINNHGDVVGEIAYEEFLYEDEEFGDIYDYEFVAFVRKYNTEMKKINSDGWANGINDLKRVVGVDYTVQNRAFIWDEHDHLRGLGSFEGFSTARANAVNNDGQVAGSVLVSNDKDNNQLATNFGRKAPAEIGKIDQLLRVTHTNGIYDFGHVAEMIQNDTFQSEAFPWLENKDVLEHSSHEMNSIRQSKQDIRGLFMNTIQSNTYRSEAFIWSEENGMANLGTLGGDWSTAWDINDLGQIVGYSSTGPGNSRAFLWDQDHGLIELPTLGGNSLARAINNNGQIVGYSYDSEGAFYPVLWEVLNLGNNSSDQSR